MIDKVDAPAPESKSPELTLRDAGTKIGGLFAAVAAQKTPAEKTPPEEKVEETEEPEVPEAESDSEEPETEQPEGESDDEEDTEEPAEPARKFTVKVDGKDEEVEEAELLSGYSRTADYTRKTQALAAERQKFETDEVAKVREERQQYATHLKALEEFFTTANAEPDWVELRSTLPADEFAARRADFEINRDRLEKVKAERAKVEATQRGEFQKQFDDYCKREADALFVAKPEWKSAEVRDKDAAAILKVVSSFGFTAQDLEQVTDHRLLLLFDKAAKWDARTQKAPAIKEKIAKVLAAKPSPSAASKVKVSEFTKAKQRLGKTGSLQDAGSALSFLFTKPE